MTKLYLFDIEGTTTDINFVHKVLFPYAASHLKEFVLHHQKELSIQNAIAEVKKTVSTEEGLQLDLDGVIKKLLEWIKTDRKHGALKEIQGHIWDVGYSKNDFKGHVYPDVKPFFEKVLNSGAQVGIYSSGSVHAQKLIFGYSSAGDLTPMIAHYFDTKIGGKRERTSYSNIANAVHLKPQDIHFFSDIPEELEAANEAGLKVTQVLREGTKPSRFEGIKDFSELERSL
ncbi:MAG: acireductone synthase [Bacteriovoracia bacterium]